MLIERGSVVGRELALEEPLVRAEGDGDDARAAGGDRRARGYKSGWVWHARSGAGPALKPWGTWLWSTPATALAQAELLKIDEFPAPRRRSATMITRPYAREERPMKPKLEPDERWIVRIAPLSDLVREKRWEALRKAAELDALDSAMGRSGVPCVCCDRPYDPSCVPALGVAIEHLDDKEIRVVLGVCSTCADRDDCTTRTLAKVEQLLEADPGQSRLLNRGGAA